MKKRAKGLFEILKYVTMVLSFTYLTNRKVFSCSFLDEDEVLTFLGSIFVLTCILYFKESQGDVVKEAIETILISIGTGCMYRFFDSSEVYDWNLEEMMTGIVLFIIAWILTRAVKSSRIVLGNYSELMDALVIALFSSLFFFAHLPAWISLIIASIIDFAVGFYFYEKYCKEVSKLEYEQQRAERVAELEKKKIQELQKKAEECDKYKAKVRELSKELKQRDQKCKKDRKEKQFKTIMNRNKRCKAYRVYK